MPKFSPSIFTPKVRVPRLLVEILRKFASWQSTDESSFEVFNAQLGQLFRAMSQRFLTRMHETVQNITSTLESRQRFQSGVHRGVAGAGVLKKRVCAEHGRRDRVRDGLCWSLQQVSETDERAVAAVLMDRSGAEMTGRRLSKKGIASLLVCVR